MNFANAPCLIDVEEIRWEDVDWKLLAQDRVGFCERGNEPSGSIKVGKCLD
jgi:hypothetical protein